jgi:hypothetical protein
MRGSPLPVAPPLRLLHPVWCCLGPECLDVDRLGGRNAVHRSKTAACQTEDAVLTLNRIRCERPRFLDGQRHEVSRRGEQAPERGREHVELTITHGGLTVRAADLGVPELLQLIALIEQQLASLQKGPFPRDYPREALTH